jgi:hypothetical protein
MKTCTVRGTLGLGLGNTGLRYGENHMSTCIHHAACQHCRLVMLRCGVCFHTLSPLIQVEQCLNVTGYLNIIANQVHPFITEVLSKLYFIFSRIMPNVTRLGFSRIISTNTTVNSAYCSGLPSHQISIQLSICGTTSQLDNCGTHWSQHPCGTLCTPCKVHPPPQRIETVLRAKGHTTQY